MNMKKISIGLLFLILALVIVPEASAYSSLHPHPSNVLTSADEVACKACHVKNNAPIGAQTCTGCHVDPYPPSPTATPTPVPTATPTPVPTTMPTPTPTPVVGQKADVTFKITDIATGKIIEKAKVSMDGITIVTNDHGIAVFKNVNLGKHNYYVTKDNYLKVAGSINVQEKTTKNVRLKRISSENEHNSED